MNYIDICLCIPFMGILLSLAFLPLWFCDLWHRHYGKIIGLWTVGFILPGYYFWGTDDMSHHLLEHLLLDYLPFIIMIGTLFIITSGIHVESHRPATPWHNMGWLGIGTLAASFIGTTGASMLLIRPLIRANAWRQHNAHVKIFFIFLVANIGGLLTPLGDPPLFIGFLQGVPFFWPMIHLLGPFLFTSGMVLFIFFWVDYWFYRREKQLEEVSHTAGIRIQGKRNFILLAAAIGLIAWSGYAQTDVVFYIGAITLKLENILRDGGLIVIGLISLSWSPSEIRARNQFSWEPLQEISKIFLGIFITVIPVIALLKAGPDGLLSGLFQLLYQGGVPNNSLYFWLSGIFSSFLDNAPTYFVFFHAAGGDVGGLTTTLCKTLTAISVGSVVMGAMTYIGNAPNFMVKSIAEQFKVKMPSFFEYIIWSLAILLPVFMLVDYIFFRN
jgi:Na+/H+ antiporter NhaD/arsenite permease-like protein